MPKNSDDEEQESTDSSDEEEVGYFDQAMADIESIVYTPRGTSSVAANFLRICYEEGQGPIEMPEYTRTKL